MSDKDCYTITETDLDCIKRLCGDTLDVFIQAALMRLYGPGGELSKCLDIINACEVSDQRYCGEVCGGICAYPSGDTLLTEICLTILCYERGLFDAGCDNYHSVMRECRVAWIKKELETDPEIPF